MTKDEAIKEVVRLIQEHNLTRADYRPHPTKGTKLPPKEIGPNGETWAGRGIKPKWMTQNEASQD
jgi:DNA-binding protein H-NS